MVFQEQIHNTTEKRGKYSELWTYEPTSLHYYQQKMIICNLIPSLCSVKSDLKQIKSVYLLCYWSIINIDLAKLFCRIPIHQKCSFMWCDTIYVLRNRWHEFLPSPPKIRKKLKCRNGDFVLQGLFLPGSMGERSLVAAGWDFS